jgi:hypothetical protein
MRTFATILLSTLLLTVGMFERVSAQGDADRTYTLSSAQAKTIIETRARAIMVAIKQRDMRRLATFVDPRKGVRFSPYNYVDTKTARVLKPSQLATLYRSRQRLLWGEYDGSGDPIRLTFRQYLNRFVYRLDLLTDKTPAYNPERRQSGTSVSNMLEVYPRSIIVVYGHEGITGPQGGGMDWQALYLIFEKTGNQWYLVGIVNDEWTI